MFRSSSYRCCIFLIFSWLNYGTCHFCIKHWFFEHMMNGSIDKIEWEELGVGFVEVFNKSKANAVEDRCHSRRNIFNWIETNSHIPKGIKNWQSRFLFGEWTGIWGTKHSLHFIKVFVIQYNNKIFRSTSKIESHIILHFCSVFVPSSVKCIIGHHSSKCSKHRG